MPVKKDVQVESHHDDEAHVLHEEGPGQDQERAVLVALGLIEGLLTQ